MTATDTALDEAVLRDSASTFCSKSAPVSRLRALRGSAKTWSPDVWREMADLGWTAMLVPEAQGGLGLDLQAMTVVLDALGRVVAPEPIIECAGLSALVLGALDSDEAADLAGSIASGDVLVATAWQGHARKPDIDWGVVQAAEHGERVVLDGTRHAVAYAADAGQFIVASLLGTVPALIAVPAGTRGLELQARQQADGTTLTTLAFRQVDLPAAAVLATGPTAERALEQALDATAILVAAYLTGLAREAFAVTLQYLKTREQFGKPIGAFQVLQHRAVNLWTQVEVASAVVAQAANQWPHANRRSAQVRLASRAKYRASDVATRITREAVQMHGAMGFTDDCDVGLYLNRALTLCAAYGNAGWHLQRLATLGEDAEAVAAVGKVVETPPDGDWNALADDDFRATVRDWFEQHYPPEMRFLPRRVHWHESRDWYARLYQRGWAAPGWPRQYGGMGLSPAKLLIFMEEQERWGVVRTPDMGIIMVGPLLIRHGSEEQRAHYLPKSLSGEYIWCQGYSEPNAGSDLASLRTEAVVDGDDFIVNGQKIWTTLAQDATHIFLLVRTDKTAKKQAGISFLLVDMKTPGITVRPIRNIAGHEEFCEVFLDDVRVPRRNLVGEPNKGWTMAKALLSFERIFLGSPKQCQYALKRLREAAVNGGLMDDPAFAERYTKLKLDVLDLETIYARFADIVKRGEALGADVSMLKPWATETFQALSELVIEAAGAQGALIDKATFGDAEVEFMSLFYNSRPATIYGGSNEIQRGILAKAVLELPDA